MPDRPESSAAFNAFGAEPPILGGVPLPANVFGNLRRLINALPVTDRQALDAGMARINGFMIGIEATGCIRAPEAEQLRGFFSRLYDDHLDQLPVEAAMHDEQLATEAFADLPESLREEIESRFNATINAPAPAGFVSAFGELITYLDALSDAKVIPFDLRLAVTHPISAAWRVFSDDQLKGLKLPGVDQ